MQTIAAERALIGAAMHNASFTALFVSELTEDSFADNRNASIYRAIAKLQAAGKPVSLASVSYALPESDGVSMAELAAIMEEAAIEGSEHSCLEIVQDAHSRRLLVQGLRRAIAQAEGGDASCIETAQAAIDAANSFGAVNVEPIGSYALDAVTEIGNLCSGIPTGFSAIDKTICGLHGGDLVIIGARPSVGKTTLAVNIATNIARGGRPVAVFELEMDKQHIAQRIAHGLSRVSREQVLNGSANASERICQAAQAMKNMPLYIIDRAGLTFQQIRSQCYRIKQRHGLELIVIDYLGLVRAERRKNGTREQEVSELSRSFKLLAREMNVPVILLSQLNRGVEVRTDQVPTLADLRESGAIEQDADVVALLYRDDKSENIVKLKIAKNRNGKTGTTTLYYHGEHFLFDSVAW